MSNEDPILPNLLTLNQLLAPVIATHQRLDHIAVAAASKELQSPVETTDATRNVVLQGLFVLSVGSLEVMMQQVQFCIYRHFPVKIKDRQLKVEHMINDVLVGDVLDTQAESAVRDVMYGPLESVLSSFEKATGVEIAAFGKQPLDTLREMKETRNLLLHNDLKINEVYKQKTGELARQGIGGRLVVDGPYLGTCLTTIKGLVIEIESQIQKKYATYSRITALKRLWDYTVFQPSVTPFDEFWEVIESADEIVPKETPPPRLGRMSSTEKQFYEIWKGLFCGRGCQSPDFEFNCMSMDTYSRRKVAFLVNASRRMR